MKQDKELPNEYISIRQIWLRRIEDCGRAISQRAVMEPNMDRLDLEIGDRTVVYSVQALYFSLVDFGEAILKSDTDQYYNNIFDPKAKEIWSSKQDNNKKWIQHAKLAIELYAFIIQTLNKYGMLFEKQPEGYSNVEMKSVEESK